MNHITRTIDSLDVLTYSNILETKLAGIAAIFGDAFKLAAAIDQGKAAGKKPIIVKADKSGPNEWLWDIHWDDKSFTGVTQMVETQTDKTFNDTAMKYLFGSLPTALGHICYESTTVR